MNQLIENPATTSITISAVKPDIKHMKYKNEV